MNAVAVNGVATGFRKIKSIGFARNLRARLAIPEFSFGPLPGCALGPHLTIRIVALFALLLSQSHNIHGGVYFARVIVSSMFR
jgi:hypothetical protein